MITVHMLFFAHLQDVAGTRETNISLADGATVRTAALALQKIAPGFDMLLDHVRVAVNAEFAGPDRLLHEGDEVAWMPPMSGGLADSLPLLTSEPIDTAALQAQVESTDMGAVVTFEGIVRDNAHGQKVQYLEYEAYAPLAEKQIAHILDEARERWGVACVLQHRVGRLGIGDCSVAVAVASPHRGEAFEACRWLMDTLKETVPIWKRESFEGGAHWVEGPDTIGIDPPPLPDYWEGTGLI